MGFNLYYESNGFYLEVLNNGKPDTGKTRKGFPAVNTIMEIEILVNCS